jgi:hypothetical protein
MEINEHAQPTEPSLIVLEIRAHMAQLDRVDEIVRAVNSMRNAVGCPSCSMVATYG